MTIPITVAYMSSIPLVCGPPDELIVSLERRVLKASYSWSKGCLVSLDYSP
jgi:hypothetical protein